MDWKPPYFWSRVRYVRFTRKLYLFSVIIFIVHSANLYVITNIKEVQFTLEQATKAQRGVELWRYPFFNLGATYGGLTTPRSIRFTPRKQTRYPLYRRLGGSQGRSERVRKISPPLEFDPRFVQPVVSPYTDYAIPVRITNIENEKEIL